ncbi:hypothetical protein GCM10010987_57140 [Bradyrhizobium guangdongense]|uniref:Uncharacterized protein n=1 Tax=Bradyrhizobium guangdongense TaxID=1325090 RepID=A0AA88B9A2_9BRAD|nr:hypothetical protein GCM10010987_57140 [Bradyrhizobium guangdongense]
MLGLGAGRSVAADLPVAMDGAHRALRMGEARQSEDKDDSQKADQLREALNRPYSGSRHASR